MSLVQNCKYLPTGRSDSLPTRGGIFGRVGHSVLFRSVRYVLLRSKKRTLHSFPFFLKFLATYQTPKERYVLFLSFLKNRKEQEERNVLLQRKDKNGKNVTFFCKERKRTERTFRSFAKNGKERENVSFFCKKNGRTLRSFFERYILILRYIQIYIYIYISKKERNVL